MSDGMEIVVIYSSVIDKIVVTFYNIFECGNQIHQRLASETLRLGVSGLL